MTDETRYATAQEAEHDPDFPNRTFTHRGEEVLLVTRMHTMSTWDRENGGSYYLRRPGYTIWAYRVADRRHGYLAKQSWGTSWEADLAKIEKKAAKNLDGIALDRAQWPAVQRAIASKTGRQADGLRGMATLADRPDMPLGTICWVWGMNRWRQGVLVKVAKSRATVAWTSPSSQQGTIYRPSRPFADIYVTDRKVELPR